MPRLQVLNGKRQGAVFDVRPGTETIIGHRQSATIAIDDPWVSWDHARLFFNNDGACWIEDLGSTNGSYVNCVRVKREVLRHEDIIFLGKTHVIFLAPADEQLAAPPVAHDPFAGLQLGPPAAPARGMPPVINAASSSPMGRASLAPDPAGRTSGAPGAGPPPRPAPTLLNMASSAGPNFGSEGGLPALHDPFASTGSPSPWHQPPPRPKKDPFADSSVDPFASGPDYAQKAPPPPPTPSQLIPAANDPARARRAFADTNADDDLLLGGRGPAPGQKSLSLSDLREDDPGGPRAAPPVDEISQLIEGYDDLDTILGDGRAVTPDPAFVRAPVGRPPTGRRQPPGRLDEATPSEMRTRPVDTDAVRRILADDEHGPATPMPDMGMTDVMPAGLPPIPTPSGGPPDEFPGAQTLLDAPALAYERARLEDEVRRLRAALDAARAGTPDAIKAAAAALRDQELGRLAKKVAQLERDLVRARQELQEKQVELDRVTDEMIEKEDRIEGLEGELRRVRGLAPPQKLGASTDADMGAFEV